MWVAAVLVPASAHETDHFTVPIGRTFADLGPELTARTCQYIERAVERTNGRIADAQARGAGPEELAALRSPDTIAAAVMHEFPSVLNYIETLNLYCRESGTQDQYPGEVVGWLPAPWIYDSVYLPLDPHQFYLLWRSPILLIDGHYVGTDKIGHFVHNGHNYFLAYRAALRRGASDDETMAAAVRVGVDGDFFLSEKGLLGRFSSGVLSNADLAANYLGLLFYRNLTEPVRLRGRMQAPLLELRDGFWRVAGHARPDSGFFTRFFDEHFDEALNPNLYEPLAARQVAAAIRLRAAALRAWYRDANGCPRPRHWYLQKRDELRTYYGADYGYMTDGGTAVGLVDVCFPAPAPDDAVAQLHLAAENGDVDAVHDLLAGGVPVDARLPDDACPPLERGVTPLQRAAAAGQSVVVRELLECGAAVDARSARGVTALHRAAAHPDVVRILLQDGAAVDTADEQGRTPLHWAARAGASRSVAILLEAEARPDACDVDRRTALHDAVEIANVACASVLLDHGADVDAAARYGLRPLHAASTGDDPALAALLLEHGARSSSFDAFGSTPLHYAIQRGDTRITRLLLAAGADPSASDAWGTTPLRLAQREKKTALVELLRAAQAQARRGGLTAAQLASSARHADASAGSERASPSAGERRPAKLRFVERDGAGAP